MIKRGLAMAVGVLALALPGVAGAQEVVDANCPGPRETLVSSGAGGLARIAQTFTAQATGRLTKAQVDVRRLGTAGEYVIQILELAGRPTNSLLAQTSIPDGAVPAGDSTIAADFAHPASVTAGTGYALSITRPDSSNISVWARTGDDCPGDLFFSASPTGPFSPVTDLDGVGMDLVYSVFVAPNPETTITKGPKDKTRKRKATFVFTSNNPGSTFQCSVDGAPFEPCNSPKIYDKLKRGKHTFQVRATDPAGNTDPTEATDSWRVRKKK